MKLFKSQLVKSVSVLVSVVLMTVMFTGCRSVASVGTVEHSVKKVSSSHKLVSSGWCAYHSYRLYEDVKHGSLGWAAFQATMAAHSCKQVFRKP